MGMTKGIKKENRRLIAAYALIFVVLLVLCYLFPYSGDDWAWGSELGIKRLNNWFEGYSGRYFGNLIVLALTRSNVLKAFTMSTVLTGTVAILNKMTGNNALGLWTSTALLALMPVTLLRQAVVWTSGFANYSTSIFLTLIYIYEIRDIFTQKPKNSPAKAIPLLVLGFGNALIVEHLTMYNIALGLGVIGFVLIKYKKIIIQHIAYFVGVIGGTVLMFSNSVYHKVADGEDNYRTFAGADIISRMKENFAQTIMTSGFANNRLLVTAIAAVCLLVLVKHTKNAGKIQKALAVLFYLPIALYAPFSYFFGGCAFILNGKPLPKMLMLVTALATVVYAASIFFFVIVLSIKADNKLKLLFIVGSAYVMIAPLLVVTPIGSRCLFAPYIMLIYLVLELFNMNDDVTKKQFNKAAPTMLVVSVIATAFLFCIYGAVYTANNERVEKAKYDSQQTDVIEVCDLPYRDFVWYSELNKDVWKDRFKSFYGIDENIKIKRIVKK